MDELAIAAIRRQLRKRLTDIGAPRSSHLRPADPEVVASDQPQLGFRLPPLMKRIYIEIGNGGFGPGYGLIGLTNGAPDDTGKTGPDIYAQFRDVHADEPGLRWPHGLSPICHWGCAILSCVDCADTNFRMRVFDPNVYEGEDWAGCLFEESAGFDEWIGDWASGVDLWNRMYGEQGSIAQILSARHPPRRTRFWCR